MFKKIKKENFTNFVSFLMKKALLYAPVLEKNVINFKKIINPQNVTLDFYNTILSPKNIIFPQYQKMIKYFLNKKIPNIEILPFEEKSKILLGVRPCDVKSFEIMNLIFEANKISDPYWTKQKMNLIIIGYGFENINLTDFYSSFNIFAKDEHGSDLFLIRKNDEDYIIRAITKNGYNLLQSLNLPEALNEDKVFYLNEIEKSKKIKTRTINLINADKNIIENFNNISFWQKHSMSCLSCGICAFICPTCHCFDINDQNFFQTGLRSRNWDSCMFHDFTLETSGHNPRENTFQRLRQRISHKFAYYVKNFAVTACVGCGRCIRLCPVNIDIFNIVKELLR